MTEKSQKKRAPSKKRFGWHSVAQFVKKYIRVFILLLILLGSINYLLNQKSFQTQLAQIAYNRLKIAIEFEKLHFNIFSGTISGKGIDIDFQKNNFLISLSEFKIRFSPTHLILGRINVNSVEADKVFIDTSNLHKSEKAKEAQKKALPKFLTRVALTRAKVNEFFLNQGSKGFYSAKNITLSSSFANFLGTNPLDLSIENIRVITPKLHLNNKKFFLKGFFTLDLSSPRLLNESQVKGNTTIEGLLIAIKKKPKPWLSNESWDEDLEKILKEYYPLPIPQDRTFLYLQEAKFNITKNYENLFVDTLKIKLNDGVLLGSGGWSYRSKDLDFKLTTEKPLPISKLPLGQAQFRTAFEQLSLTLNLNGKLEDLKKNNINLQLNGQLLGNLVNPEAGNLSAFTKGIITNGVYNSSQILVSLDQGKITGNGSVNFNELTSRLQFKCEQFDIQTTIRLFTTLNAPAKANCDGELSGSLKNPNLSVSLQSQLAGYEFLTLGPAKGQFKIQNKTLDLNVASTASDYGQVKLDLNIKDVFEPFEQVLDMKIQFEKMRLNKVINTQTLDGFATGNFFLKRVKNKNSGSGKAEVINLTVLEEKYGKASAPFTLVDKHIEIKPIRVELFEKPTILTSKKGIAFDFDDYGYTFNGEPLDGLTIQGKYLKSNKTNLDLTLTANKASLFVLKPFIPLEMDSSQLSGTFKTNYNVENPLMSIGQGKITALKIKSNEGNFELKSPAPLAYNKKNIEFTNFEILHGRGNVKLHGILSLEDNSNLKISGPVDFNAISELNPFITYSEKLIDLNLLLKGDITAPQIFGQVTLKNHSLEFRKILSDFENLSGTLVFDGYKISTENFQLLYDDADLQLSGWIKTNYEVITDANLKMVGREVPVHMDNGVDLLSDLDLTVAGSNQNLLIQGDLNIIEGRYTQDYGITNFIIKPKQTLLDDEDENRWAMLPINTRLNLRVRNPGEFIVKNNMANLDLNITLDITGTLKTPLLSGQIDFLSGQITTLGIYFEDANGYAQFRKEPNINPNIELKAQTEVQDYMITLRANGTLENFKLDLESNPTLDRKDIISLLFYGQTSDQLVNNAREEFLQTAAIAQLASVLSRPISKFSGLDFFSVSERQENSQETTQRLAFGKSLTSRFNVAFTTDIDNNENPERAIEIEFLIFDAFSVVAAKDFGDRYRFDLNLKFESF